MEPLHHVARLSILERTDDREALRRLELLHARRQERRDARRARRQRALRWMRKTRSPQPVREMVVAAR
jgi:hypothetical protein